MSFLEEMHKPDILDCISHLSSDEVFTPPKLVNEILNTLPQELFQNPDTKFLDPCCKSGVFLREIAKRLIEGLKDKIPSLEQRLEHIFKNQLYGLAITQLTGLLSRRSLYCSKDASSEFSIVKFPDKDGNIEYKRTYHIWLKDKCMMCGASKAEYDRGEELETYAYSFIHCDSLRRPELFKRLKDMKFDVIIGNPPYQLETGATGRQAKPIYQLFIQQAKKLNPRYITMIIPARWYSGGMNLDSFRDEMLNDKSLRYIVDFPKSQKCFPGVEIKGGICYFLWDRDNKGLCKVISNYKDDEISQMERPLLEEKCSTFIRHNQAISILRKVVKFNEPSFSTKVVPLLAFGLSTDFKNYTEEFSQNSLILYANNKRVYIDKKLLPKGANYLNKYKIFISEAYGAGEDYPHQILNKPFIGEQNSCCTATYMMIAPDENKKKVENALSYIKTKFFRFMVMLKKNTQHATKAVYELVPLQDFSQEWTDEKLYKKYNLTQEEIDFIESMIRPME